jgi:hypothetical protein
MATKQVGEQFHPFAQTQLYRDWYQQVVMPPENDYIIAISASSHTPVSGTGKTTQGAGIAKALDRSPEGFDAETQATLNAETFANETIPEAPDRGSVLMDETQGTPGEGSGMNRMRAMSQSTMDAIGSLLANRDKNLTVVVVVQRLGMLFSDFFPLIDAWLLIKKAPGEVGGPLAMHHKVHVEDYPDAGGGMRTPGVEMLSWPAIEHGDPDYQALEAMKQEAKTKGGSEDDEDAELTDDEQLRHALNFKRASRGMDDYTAQGVAWTDLVDDIQQKWGIELTYSGEWYRQRLADKLEDDPEGDD